MSAGSSEGRAAAWTSGTLLGFAVGYLWGGELSGQHSWPKLFWVSIALGLVAFALGVMRSNAPPTPPSASPWRQLLTPPWDWDSARMFGFALINLGIMFGIALGFGPSWTP